MTANGQGENWNWPARQMQKMPMCGNSVILDGDFWAPARNGARSGENGAVTYGYGEKNTFGRSLAEDKTAGIIVLRKLAHEILRAQKTRAD